MTHLKCGPFGRVVPRTQLLKAADLVHTHIIHVLYTTAIAVHVVYSITITITAPVTTSIAHTLSLATSVPRGGLGRWLRQQQPLPFQQEPQNPLRRFGGVWYLGSEDFPYEHRERVYV